MLIWLMRRKLDDFGVNCKINVKILCIIFRCGSKSALIIVLNVGAEFALRWL
jgi:hypothetical protein